MMIDTIIDQLIDVIKKDKYFDNIRVINAYPFKTKPTRITKAYVALGIYEINMKSYNIDDSQRRGEVSVFADIFVPVHSDNGYISEIFMHLCDALKCFNVLSVSASGITADSDIQAVVMKTVITFDDEIHFGGDGIE